MAEVDLHMHTTRSDGGLTPTALVELLYQRGLKVVAITDHDTTAGLDEAMDAAARYPELTIIPGVEISADVSGGEIHVLAYYVDREDQRFQGILEGFRRGRLERGRGMVEKLTEMGMPLSWDRVLEIAGDASVGRPHVAVALLEKGYVSDRKEAFDKYIGRNGPAYVERDKLTPEEAIQLALENGALPVLAHPVYISDVETWLPKLTEAGLVGIEVFYGDWDTSKINRYLRLAKQYNLIPCGGSDYHANGTAGEVLPGHQGPPMQTVERLRQRKAERAGA